MAFTIEPSTAQELLSSLPIGIVTATPAGEVTWINDAMKALLGIEAGKPVELGEATRATLQTFLGARGTFPVLEGQQNGQKWLKHTMLRLGGAGGLVAHIYEDVTEAKDFQQERDQLAETVRRQSTTDALTGLLTQHAIMQGLQPLVSLSRRYDKPLSVVMIRLQHLEALDRQGGKPSSADALVGISRLLKDQMRWADLIGRYSSDQFLLVLPETDKQAAGKLVEKLDGALSQYAASAAGRVGFLYGVTEWIKGDDVNRLLKRAQDEIREG